MKNYWLDIDRQNIIILPMIYNVTINDVLH